ncbi:MAG: hypothetical protein GY844_30930 [Bradyrhizobium sp.]|nr:hypothetical protein [Bradyrhizobium sp.]
MTGISIFSTFVPAGARPTAPAARDDTFTIFAISPSDNAALSGALDEIDAALAQDFAKTDTGAPDAFDVASRIDDLISGQTASGKLTSDQADMLRSLLAGDGSDDLNDGPGDWVTVDGAGGPGSEDPVLGFLRQVQDAQTSFGGYLADGTKNSAFALTSLLFNNQA